MSLEDQIENGCDCFVSLKLGFGQIPHYIMSHVAITKVTIIDDQVELERCWHLPVMTNYIQMVGWRKLHYSVNLHAGAWTHLLHHKDRICRRTGLLRFEYHMWARWEKKEVFWGNHFHVITIIYLCCVVSLEIDLLYFCLRFFPHPKTRHHFHFATQTHALYSDGRRVLSRERCAWECFCSYLIPCHGEVNSTNFLTSPMNTKLCEKSLMSI